MTAALADPAVDLDVDLDAQVPCHVKVADVQCDLPAAWLIVYRCPLVTHQTLICEKHMAVLLGKIGYALAGGGYRILCRDHQLVAGILRTVRL